MSVTFSCEKPSGTASTVLYPRPQPISASPTPVLPAVASKIVEPGFKHAIALGLGNHAQCGTVFDAAARIQVLQLGVDVGRARGNQLAKMKKGVSPTSSVISSATRREVISAVFMRTQDNNQQGYVKWNKAVNVERRSLPPKGVRLFREQPILRGRASQFWGD